MRTRYNHRPASGCTPELSAAKARVFAESAAYSLNTVVLKVEHGRQLNYEMVKLVKIAVKGIEEIRVGIGELKTDSEELMNKRMTFLDWYRRKPNYPSIKHLMF